MIQGKTLDQKCSDLENFLFESVCIPAFTIGRVIAMKIPDDVKLTAAGASDPKESGRLGTISSDHTKTLVVVKEKLLSLMIGAKFLIQYFRVLELVDDLEAFEADMNAKYFYASCTMEINGEEFGQISEIDANRRSVGGRWKKDERTIKFRDVRTMFNFEH